MIKSIPIINRQANRFLVMQAIAVWSLLFSFLTGGVSRLSPNYASIRWWDLFDGPWRFVAS
jgi:hypothetical protein